MTRQAAKKRELMRVKKPLRGKESHSALRTLRERGHGERESVWEGEKVDFRHR